ncbi:MAG: sugar phosphate nucleotidyltransferase, partial [Candidatus Binatota bacterium]
MKIKKAVIPVAGLGTRFLPATKTVPKELLPIVDTPAIQYVVQEAVDSGISEVIFVTGRNKDSIEDHFDENPELDQVLEERGQT